MIVRCHLTGAGHSKAGVSEHLGPRQALFDNSAPDYLARLSRRVSSPVEDADGQTCAGPVPLRTKSVTRETTPTVDAHRNSNKVVYL